MNDKIVKIQKSFQKIIFLSPFRPTLLQVKSKIRLNASLLRLNFLEVTWLRGLKSLHPGCATDCDLKILAVI